MGNILAASLLSLCPYTVCSGTVLGVGHPGFCSFQSPTITVVAMAKWKKVELQLKNRLQVITVYIFINK